MPKVIMICGKLCSGKSTYAKKLQQEGKAVVLSIDEIMLAEKFNAIFEQPYPSEIDCRIE